MTKKKNIASKLVLVLFVLTLISCCLLGSTIARYVSSGTGSASVGIAKWDVTGLPDSASISVTKISPKKEAATDDNATTPRQNIAVDATVLATITNNSDVSADVTVTLSGLSFKKGENVVTFGTTGWATDSKPSQAEMMDTVQLQFGTSANEQTQPTTWSTVNSTTSFEVYKDTLGVGSTTSTQICIWYRVIWESQDDNAKVDDADAFDTWIGENVTKISANITFSAVQGSELP